MKKTFDFLKNKTKVNFLSTLDNGRPSCRPFGDPVLYNDKIYILTQAHKSVARQIAEDNHVCIVAYDGEQWIRVNCELIDDSLNLRAKQAIIDEFDWAEEAGYTLENPDFKTFYLANADAKIYDENGNVITEEKF